MLKKDEATCLVMKSSLFHEGRLRKKEATFQVKESFLFHVGRFHVMESSQLHVGRLREEKATCLVICRKFPVSYREVAR